jgi:hypothetical protein
MQELLNVDLRKNISIFLSSKTILVHGSCFSSLDEERRKLYTILAGNPHGRLNSHKVKIIVNLWKYK